MRSSVLTRTGLTRLHGRPPQVRERYAVNSLGHATTEYRVNVSGAPLEGLTELIFRENVEGTLYPAGVARTIRGTEPYEYAKSVINRHRR